MKTSASSHPPRLAERFLEAAANRADGAAIAGDASEEFQRRIGEQGLARARRWYRLFVLKSIPSFIRHFISGNAIMIKNYFTIAGRLMNRQKAFTFINVLGLAAGMACSVMIGLFVVHESRYDRFHEKADRIFRVYADIRDADGDTVGAWTPPPLAGALAEDFPEVEAAARYNPWPREILISAQDRSFIETGIQFADASFFKIFSYPFVYGDPATALEDPFTVVISRRTAEKYFGHDNPVGRTLTFKDIKRDFKVTGVIENPSPNSHLRFEILASLVTSPASKDTRWNQNTYFTYVLLREGAAGATLAAKLPDFTRRRYGPQFLADTGIRFEDYYKTSDHRFGFGLEPLTAIHLNPAVRDNLSLKGNPSQLKLLSAVAFFILLIAAINFMNLSVARFAHRSREVGIRKVLGSRKSQLVVQFLGESLLMSAIALVLALAAMAFLLPAFSRLAQRPIAFADVFAGGFPVLLAAIVLIVGLAAGSYPALFLSSFSPQATIKGRYSSRGKGHAILRRGLVLVQFAVGFAVLFGTGVISRQMNFLGTRDLGFDRDHVVVINKANALGPAGDAFEADLLADPRILKVSRSQSLPGRHFDPNGHLLEGQPSTEEKTLMTIYVDDRFADLLGLKLAAGRFFSRQIATDATSAVVINETAARELGLSEPVGKRFYKTFGGAKEGEFVTVIGVLKDFHFASLHRPIERMLLRPLSPAEWQLTAVKVRGEDLPQTLAFIEKTWNRYAAGRPIRYSFLDQEFGALYESERRAGKIFSAFSILAVLIACLGLYGLVSFAAEQRMREIGIRKTLGASAANLAGLLTKEVIWLVGIAAVIASPPALILARRWLQDFAFRISIRPWMFLATGAAVLAVAVISVAYRAVRAATSNPVVTLRHE